MPDHSVFFQLHPSLKQVIYGTLQWKGLRSIQESAYGPISCGSDILLTARTAGGKSEAAFIPILDQILKQNPDLPVCLYISPLRALITDMADRLDHLLTPLHLSVMQVHGDLPCSSIPVSDPPAVVMTTPESLLILLQGASGSFLVDRVRFCVIDEVHSLAASERGAQLISALALIERRSGRQVQRIGLSATIGNPDAVLSWMSRKDRLSQVVRAEHETLPREFIFMCEWNGQEKERLENLIQGRRSLIFARSRGEAEILSCLLEDSAVPIFVHHSSLSPVARKEAEQAFLRGRSGSIICTSTLELGIDIGSLDLIVHSGPVVSISSFLQRLGRVGRRGDPARMAFLLRDPKETVLVAAAISAAVAGVIEPVQVTRYPYRVLVQQIILSLLSDGRIPCEALISRIKDCETFAEIPEDRISLIISSLISNGFIISDRGFYMPGPPLETWADLQHGSLYSVIGEGRTCTVRSPEGDLVGTVSKRGGDLCRDGSFRLGGRSWKSTGIDTDPGTIQVTPVCSPALPPVFGGSFQGTSYPLLKALATLVRDGLSDLPFPRLVHEAVDTFVNSLPPGVGPDTMVLRREGDLIRLYTFLGDEWNRVLGRFLKEECRKKGIKKPVGAFDGISVSVSSADVTPEWVLGRIAALSLADPADPGEWILTLKEPGRSFDQFLPEDCLREMLIMDRIRFDELVQVLRLRQILITPEIKV